MALDPNRKARYARHVLLPEIGERGQELLCGAAVALSGDPRAIEAAQAYLGRSGVRLDGGTEVRVAELAAPSSLSEAAAFLAGAWAAVETIKKIVGCGAPGEPPSLEPPE